MTAICRCLVIHPVFNITEIYKGGAAEAAGMLVDDIIVAFDGNEIKNYEDLEDIMQYYAANEVITVTVQRRNMQTRQFEKVELEVKLCERFE